MSTARIYDKYWNVGGHYTSEWTPEFFKGTVSELIGLKRILDYGCGMGYSYQDILHNAVHEYVGADISLVAVDNTRKKGYGAILISEDGRIDVESEGFDGAICSEVFEHLWDPLAAAQEIQRVLKPGGVLVATVPNFGYLPWRLMALLHASVPMEPEAENRYRGVHIRFFSKALLAGMLRDAGFTSVKVYGWCGSSIWDVFWCTGPLSRISTWAHRWLPRSFHLPFLGWIFPSVFSERLRVVAIK